MKKMNIEQATDLRRSSFWDMVVGELDYRIEAEVNKLKTCSHGDFPYIQNAVKLLESFKHMPQDVIDRETLDV